LKTFALVFLSALVMGQANPGRNMTNSIQLTQGLFDNISQNFIAGAFEGLQNMTIEPVNGTLKALGVSVDFNLTNLNLS